MESGKRLRRLDFPKAPWPEIQSRLREVDWGPLESLAKESVRAAHTLFMDTLLPIVEELVPQKVIGKRFGHSKNYKKRRCLWRKLGRMKKMLHSTSSASKAALLLQKQHDLELQLKRSYNTQSWEEETKVVNAMKINVKALYAYGRARQKTNKVGPFLDPTTGMTQPRS